jgi:hypothetical protein
MNSSLFLLAVLTGDQAIQQAPSAVFKSHKQQAVTEEADKLSEPNTVDELSWNKSIYDRFSHSTSCMFFGLLNTDICKLRVFKDMHSSNYS